MSDQPKPGAAVDPVRRKLLKASALAGGALAAGVLPYEKPAVKSFFGTRSAWAQMTPPLTINFGGRLGTQPSGTADPNAGQDRWEFEVLYPNTTLTITATPDANLDIEIYLYPPGPIAFGDDNLLQGVGNPLGLNSGGGVGAVESAMLTVAAAGIYTFAIEDDRAPAAEVAGDYSVVISGDMTLGAAVAVVDEGPESDQTTGPTAGPTTGRTLPEPPSKPPTRPGRD